MNTTTNLGLKKPQKAAGDPIDIDVLNDNSDIIDNFAGITAAKLTADEAALAEVVDAGAKSLFPVGVSDTTFYGATVTVNDGVITINGTTTNQSSGSIYQDLVTAETSWKNTRYTLPAGEYGCKGSGVSGLQIQIYCHDGTDATELFSGRNDGTFVYSTSDKISKPYIAFRLGCNPLQTFSNAKVYPMICTKAAWDISHEFKPYCPSMAEMYEKLTDDEADITSLKHMVNPRSQSQVSSGNLDNITVSEMRVYSSPSGLPTGVSASSVCIVETCVVDSNSAYQVITLLSNQGTAQNRSYPTYKRVKVGGVWYDWKLIVS